MRAYSTIACWNPAQVTIAVAAVAVPTDAQARRGWWGPGALIGGLAAGAIIAGAAGAYGPYGYGYRGPASFCPRLAITRGAAYAYGPGCFIRRERAWDGFGWRLQRVRVCY